MAGNQSRHGRTRVAAGVVILVGVASFLGGCVSTHRIEVDAIASPGQETEPISYRLESGHPHLGPGDAVFESVAAAVRTALSGRGWYEATDTAHADQIIQVDFGGSGPLKHYLIYLGGYGTDAPVSGGGPTGLHVLANGEVTGPGADRVQHVSVIEKYEIFLRLTSRRPASQSERADFRQCWSVHLRVVVDENDPGRYLPMLIAAAMDHVNEDAPGIVEVELREDDPAIAFVQAGR
jgi:hypothetical protein